METGIMTFRRKHIVLCSDGTGNRDIKARGTNVFKLYEAVDIHGHEEDKANIRQVAYYEDGLGTANFLLLKVLSGAFGWGFSRGVKRLYEALVHVYNKGDNYNKGDKIFLFGFSRGGYTVRALSGLINCHGIVPRDSFNSPKELKDEINDGWRKFMLEQRSESISPPNHPVPDDIFIGVWDTVGALGLPFVDKFEKLWNAWFSKSSNFSKRFPRLHNWSKKEPFVRIPRFKDHIPSDCVTHARQALAIDDWRKTFHPVLWDEKGVHNQTNIKQVWFVGAHSNVGGGYPKQGLSLVALDWMMREAEEQNLRFNKADREFVRDRRDPHSKLYDSRAGFYAFFYRWEPRYIWNLCLENGEPIPQIHESVLERIALDTDGYAPLNLPSNYVVTRTKTEHNQSPQSALAPVYPQVTDNTTSLLAIDETKQQLYWGRFFYWGHIFSTLTVVIFLIASFWWHWTGGIGAFVCFFLAVKWKTRHYKVHDNLRTTGWVNWKYDRETLRDTMFHCD
jgi:hypothetical protein